MKQSRKSIVIMGAGGHAKSCVDVIESTEKYDIFGLTGKIDELGSSVLGYPVIGTDEMLIELVNKLDCIAIGVGQIRSTRARERCFQRASELGFELPVIASPGATVSTHSKIGCGTIIFHGAIINASAEIGIGSIINSQAILEHDVKIGDFCHISTGVIVNGSSEIGSHCFVGSGTVVSNDVTMSCNSFVKSGSVVTENS